MKLTTELLKSKANDDFRLYHKDDFDIFGYAHNGAFHSIEEPCAEHLEMRFSKFDKEGNCISRPMEKFFNFGDGLTERFFPDFEISQNPEDWVVGNKYDGSLINPVVVNDELFFFTKMGLSEVAMQFDAWFSEVIDHSDIMMLKNVAKNVTINFEFISPFNKIVVDYSHSKAVILSARMNDTGEYIPMEDLKKLLYFLRNNKYSDFVYFTNYYPLGMVYDGDTLDECIENTRASENTEGEILIHKETNIKYKVKTQWYLERHGLVGIRFNFQNVLKNDMRQLIDIILLDQYDDILAEIKEPEIKEDFWDKFNLFNTWLNNQIVSYKEIEDVSKKMTKKEFALSHAKNMKHALAALIFKSMDGEEIDINDIITHFQKHFSKMSLEDVQSFWEKEIK